nr:MAG TPA: hypothetical protein [Caudoviricetes sp.]
MVYFCIQNKKTAEAILIDFLYSHDIMDIEKGRAGNTPHVEPLKRRWLNFNGLTIYSLLKC